MGVSIRAATAAEREATVTLWEAAGLTRPWNDPRSDFDLALATPTSTILLAEAQNQPIGSVMVGFDGHRGWVYYLATSPDRRGQGIGRALMAAAEDWLKALGSPKIQLMVRGDNASARGFYNALGYELQDVVTIGKRF
ncbi:GNAT family acetyltransferase [Novosphingobium jiangmenense]|uniref:GNAT family acetyltransferase n=1 Tax=Novosphingobium jiangmenense TaxID=2791981 RepID=A0ABS0HFZ2_9SPHN|nr:GNAT family acetyltransferase [Novosphingobium jiangmenense]